MTILNTIISVFYFILAGVIAAGLIYNLIKSKDWKEEVLYILVLIPFLLRVLLMK
ncbi:MAG: hypothetical protein RBS37_09315 [Bacteroidales bacterium]|jgi:hypothetical protein|nr:hypothetical protein [Bacteroidales bacterium]